MTPHNRKTSMFDFLFTSHNGLSVVIVVGTVRFLAGDVTRRKRQMMTDQGSNGQSVMSVGHDMARIYDSLTAQSDTGNILTDKLSCSLTLA